MLATVSPLASGAPDGLEKIAEQQGFATNNTASPFQLAADYLFPGIQNKTLATMAAGWLGVLAMFAAVYAISWLITRRRRSHPLL
jgi:hypothetical protein